MSKKILKSDSEWETCLTPEEYKILREKGTEMAFTGKFYNHKEDGTYSCAGCDYELFSSETKFDSGTGWPSFYQALEKDRIIEKEDKTLGMTRVEILCARCESHLGHVFTDGPNPTGLRYCVNSVSLDFKELK
ncbi:MAG: peptide-methionine (R)-S-oxide reductase MsrB [Candidatus Marinimicrobia bacterium]|nr:peptide-methionine (R)-S-oxide reductase MsrB [Candidatus Neomarinimicrobiota bacterium]